MNVKPTLSKAYLGYNARGRSPKERKSTDPNISLTATTIFTCTTVEPRLKTISITKLLRYNDHFIKVPNTFLFQNIVFYFTNIPTTLSRGRPPYGRFKKLVKFHAAVLQTIFALAAKINFRKTPSVCFYCILPGLDCST